MGPDSTPLPSAVCARDGLTNTGGADIDQAVIGYLGEVYGGWLDQQWRRLNQPTTPEERRAVTRW